MQKIHECLEINETGHRLAEYMKTVDREILTKCNETFWLLSLESPNAPRAFITKTPKEMYTSDKPPVVDIMFVMASQVFHSIIII